MNFEWGCNWHLNSLDSKWSTIQYVGPNCLSLLESNNKASTLAQLSAIVEKPFRYNYLHLYYLFNCLPFFSGNQNNFIIERSTLGISPQTKLSVFWQNMSVKGGTFAKKMPKIVGQ